MLQGKSTIADKEGGFFTDLNYKGWGLRADFVFKSGNWINNFVRDVQSYNVIGEIRGSESPNKFIVVGGHLDSWDLGDGSHDDGAGCVQSLEVLRLLKKVG